MGTKPKYTTDLLITSDFQEEQLVTDKSEIYNTSKNKHESEKNINQKLDIKQYFLCSKYPDLYFTCQEARCLYYFMQGFNNDKTGNVMGLSARTIGFYDVNMRSKLGCKTQEELVALVRESEFMNDLEKIKELEEN